MLKSQEGNERTDIQQVRDSCFFFNKRILIFSEINKMFLVTSEQNRFIHFLAQTYMYQMAEQIKPVCKA